ncbi:M28 family peptidase [bacterium]|nr:M28 family peptidase [bacterium]
MHTRICKLLPLFLLLPVLAFGQTADISADSIYANIHHLSVTIGPRPMGSAAENEALAWTAARLQSFGADSVFIMPYTIADAHGARINTTSGVSVGIFRGETDSSIVVGGHIDSDSREIPGANDNASGPATMLELARVWSQRPRHYTMIFCAFGGEERGLIGSHHFVDTYEDIDKVALMFSIDMTGADDDIITIMETDTMNAPVWLMKDAFAMDRALGINRLTYPTHFGTINNIGGGGAGSDHIPFLKKRIPAMDFTQGINRHPIHTPMDRIEYIDRDMLDTCARLIDGLLVKYQSSTIPSGKSGRYILMNIFGRNLFFPGWTGSLLLLLAVAAGVTAVLISRKQRLIIPKPERVRFSGWKLFFMFAVMVICVRLGDSVMQLITGLRYPWFLHLSAHLWSSLLWLALGTWVVLQLTRKWRFSPDPYVYAKRGIIILFVLTLLFALVGGGRMAAYPGISLILFSLALSIRTGWLRTLFVVLGPLPLARLMFMEAFPFMAHFNSYAGFEIDSAGRALLFNTGIFLVLLLWYLPFIFTFAWNAVTVKGVRRSLVVARRPLYGIIILVLTLACSGYLATLPAYNDMWRPMVRVDARYSMETGKSTLEIKGNEYLRDVSVTTDSVSQYYSGGVISEKLNHSFTAGWIDAGGTETCSPVTGDTIRVNCSWTIAGERPWYTLTVTVWPDTLSIYDVDTDLAYTSRYSTYSFTWQAEPPNPLHMQAAFTIGPGTNLIRRIVGAFPELPIDMTVSTDNMPVRYRTWVTRVDTLKLDIGTTE